VAQVTPVQGAGKQPGVQVPLMQVWFAGQVIPAQGSTTGTQVAVQVWPFGQLVEVQGLSVQVPARQISGDGQSESAVQGGGPLSGSAASVPAASGPMEASDADAAHSPEAQTPESHSALLEQAFDDFGHWQA
jgi:hypothetical protein